jgi:hypothetical protein
VGEGRVEGIARRRTQHRNRTSRSDSLHLTQCNFILCPVVEFGCSRRLVSRNLLGVLEPSVVFQVNRDAGCLPSVTSYWNEKARSLGPLPNRSPDVVPVKLRTRPVTAVPSEFFYPSGMSTSAPLSRQSASRTSFRRASSEGSGQVMIPLRSAA